MNTCSHTKIFIVSILVLLSTIQITFHATADHQLPESSPAITCQYIGDTIRLTYQVPDFFQKPILINNEDYSQIILDTGASNLAQGMPDLPHITTSIMIPQKMTLTTQLQTQYLTYTDIQVSPSKGNLPRTTNPSTVPYQFNEIYTEDTWYPEQIIELNEPYILRDFCGQTIQLTPFQYNPATKELRFYTDIRIDLSSPTSGSLTCFPQANQPRRVDSDFSEVYEHQFINFNMTYIPVEEQGNMLVITYDEFWSTMLPFVQWKNMKGIRTEMINVSQIGSTASAIQNFIANYYSSYGLTYVLLVGDHIQVPTIIANGCSSDTSYSYILGSDHYPDLFIGRFSAETIPQLETQVQRTNEYEQNPQIGAEWYHKGSGIASNQGPGDDDEYDWEHMRNIRTDLLNYQYTIVDEFYDGSHGGEDAPENPTASMISSALNSGRGIINYCGHGSITAWSTSGFSNYNITNLLNDNQLPFIFSAACSNGKFETGTCFAEAWLRSTHDGEPVGAIATFMSSRAQSWDPPMDAQDEMIDILIESYGENKKNTFGGIAYSGCMHMNDQYGSSGDVETDNWQVFGDPSLQIRTKTPESLSVTHDSTVYVDVTTFDVYVEGVHDALCGLSRNYRLLGYGYTDETGHATIQLFEPMGGKQNVDLVVTGYNKIPYFASLTVSGGFPPETPSQPLGPSDGNVNEYYDISVRGVEDPQQQDVFYYFDWGDGYNTGWIGPYPSGEEFVEATHKWRQPGYYQVTVKAKDTQEMETNFSEPLHINIGQRLEILNVKGGLRISADIKNTLPLSKYVDYTIEIIGGSFSGFHVNKYLNGTLFLESNSITTLQTRPFFALGKVKIKITVTYAGSPLETKTINGFVFFFYTFIR